MNTAFKRSKLKLLERTNGIGYLHCMDIASPEQIIKPKIHRVTLRDGRVLIMGGLSVSQLKHLRKHGGFFTIQTADKKEEMTIDGKLIKQIQPHIPPQA